MKRFTVKELKEKVAAIDPEFDDFKVGIYLAGQEDGDFWRGELKFVNKEQEPYYKGDSIHYGVLPDEEIILLVS